MSATEKKPPPAAPEPFSAYLASDGIEPLFLQGDSLGILRRLPERSVDFVITSPPHWGKRAYATGGNRAGKRSPRLCEGSLRSFP